MENEFYSKHKIKSNSSNNQSLIAKQKLIIIIMKFINPFQANEVFTTIQIQSTKISKALRFNSNHHHTTSQIQS
jgi:hypothetical protein